MAARSWTETRAKKRISTRMGEVPSADISIKKYVRDTSLQDIPRTVAYRVDGVHLYADILNLEAMLNVTDVEGETCHRRTLRFLNLHYRAVHRILQRVDALFVDFHNQRLHSVIAKPYDSEARRIHRAIAISQLIIDVLEKTGEDADHPAAKVRVGIDSGEALAVSNGRRGHREPLFLGEPANHAAKRSGGGRSVGIFLTNNARATIGLDEVDDPDVNPLTVEEIEASQEESKMGVEVDDVVDDWKEDLEKNPIGSFGFSSHTPPFSTLDLETLTVKNSRRQDAATIYADIDGFTAYVSDKITTDAGAKDVVRALHVIRSELDAVLHSDFAGRKVRFIGDCIHGLLVEGTAQTTDAQETISNMTLCAAAMHSSFGLCLDKLREDGTDAEALGLAIGFEYGAMTATRLGIRGELVRCSVSRGVITAEKEQHRCDDGDTAIGKKAYDSGSEAVRKIFGGSRKRGGLMYQIAVDEMSGSDDGAAKRSKALAAASVLKPASAAAAPVGFPAHPVSPTRPDGFS